MKKIHFLLGVLLLSGYTYYANAQVSNDNEDGVNKVDAHHGGSYDFVPGHVLVKFKEESSIEVQHTARGQFRAASISKVDQLLRNYGVKDMEKLFPAEVAKPKSQLRRKKAPNGTIVQEKNLDKVFWIKTSVEGIDSTMQLIEQLKEMPEVEYAEPNYRVYITADMPQNNSPYVQPRQSNARRTPVAVETTASILCPNPDQNPLYTNQYNIRLHNIDKLWDKPIINKKRPVIAILDTGVDINHPDLQDNIWVNTAELEGEKAYDDDGNGIVDDIYGWNFADNYRDLTDRNGHGTHVAGIAAACDNGVGIVGANPQALIMNVKVLNDRGFGDIASYCRGMIYAANMGADIINMSFGHSWVITQTEVDAIQKAYITTILVASAGNNGASVYDILGGPLWPAAYYLVLGVQAADKNGNRVGWSNYDPDGPIYSEDGIDGKNHEMLLAGVDIYSTLPNGQYNKLSGTSMSAPLLAGAISALQMVKEYPSKDVLFGDLIHLNADFEKIFCDETPRWPKIDVVSMEVDDDVMNNNADGQVDAGETIKFYPVLRNTWADATDIKLKLSVDNYYKDFVQIINPQVDFGYSISAYGRQKAESPIVVQFSNNIGHNTRIRFTMTISYHENEEPIQQDIYVTVYNMVKIGGLISSDITLTADKNYLVSSNLAIPEGVTLTIEPGTTLRFAKNTGLSSQGNLIIQGTPQKPIVLTSMNADEYWGSINSSNPIEYCVIENSMTKGGLELRNCIISNNKAYLDHGILSSPGKLYNCNYVNSFDTYFVGTPELIGVNILNNNFYVYLNALPRIESFEKVNYFNLTNESTLQQFLFAANEKSGSNPNPNPTLTKPETTAYMGTSREDIANTYIWDIDYDFGFEQIDLTNLRKTPYSEAHGIVWKVVVNGFDAQDEYEQLPPLGVGKHKFEVYFNRPMNKAKIPQITFGVREPYNQHTIDEDGAWNEEGTIYTAYKTITGKTMSDGVNRIYVQGAEDNEYFECPYEKTRFNINIQAAGSMATGFAAEEKMGRVDLTWTSKDNDFSDAMGFNIYRYTMEGENQTEPVRLNDEVILVKEVVTEDVNSPVVQNYDFTDYDVTPGQTYYYMYKVLSTDLQEYDVSNVVAATPLTTVNGDADGSGDVKVGDVISTVNYILGENPKPFIFEAADVNTDQNVDVLDVIGIIQLILNQPSGSRFSIESMAQAVYTVEDGVLYIETPVTLAGVQAQLSLNEKGKMSNENLAAAKNLKGFEIASTWLTESDYRMLAYSFGSKVLMPGKHAIMTIGDADITSLRLSDTQGNAVLAVPGDATLINDAMGSKVLNTKGVWNLSGQKVSGNDTNLRKGVYIIDGQKIVK